MNPMFSESAAFALQRLTDLGWSPVAAQGMVGNLIQESGPNLNPTASHDGGTGFGIAGFRDPQPGEGRWTNLRRFSRERGLDHRTLDVQLQFIDHELRTSERGVGDRLRQARDPAEAARTAISFFRPAGWTSRNPTGGHGWENRLQNTMALAGAPMPTNRIALDQVQQASAAPPMLPPPRPGGLGGLGGTEPPASYASMGAGPSAPAQGGGDPNQTVPAAMMSLNAGDDRAPRAEAFGQTIPSLRQAGIDPRETFFARQGGADSFGLDGPQPFTRAPLPDQNAMAGLGPRGGGVAAMQQNPMRAPQQGMPPVVGAVQGASAGPPMPNVSAVAQAAQPQQPQQPPMAPPRPSNIGGQNMPRGIDPNQYAGGEWIPPDVGRQLAAQQMGGQANMPAQGAQAAQGGGIAPSAPQGSPGGLGGLGGLRGPLHAAFLSMLTANDRRAPFANMPAFMQQQMQMDQQMQAQRQAEADRMHDQQLLFGGGEGGAQSGGQPAQAAPGGGGQQGEAPVTPSSFATGNRTVDGLLARRQDITRRMMMARTDEARKALEAQRNQIDAEIGQRSPTSAIKEYSFDMDQRQQMGMPPIPFKDWDAERAAARRDQVSVDARQMGNIPPGYRVRYDEGGNPVEMEPIPGGPVDRELREAEQQAAGRARATQQAGGTVVQDLGRALNLAPNMVRGDGVVGANARLALARVPGTTEYTINSFKESALSNIGLDTLQRMRENSPTGGALGQVPIQQQARLEQVLGSLDLGQSPEIIEDNMKRVMNIYTDIMFGDEGERAQAVKDGRMTQQEADRISGMYYDLSFDERGRPIDRNQSSSGSESGSRRMRFNPETGEIE